MVVNPSRLLVLRHGETNTDMVVFRQENNGQLSISITATNVAQLSTPGLLRCVRNTLVLRDLFGTYYHNNNFICRELLALTQHDAASPALGALIRAAYTGNDTPVDLSSIAESMILARKSTQEIFAVFIVNPGSGAKDIRLILFNTPESPTAPSAVIHNDMPVDTQAALLRFSVGNTVEHFSLFDFMYDVKKREDCSPRMSTKLNSLYVAGGGNQQLVSHPIHRTGATSAGVDIPVIQGNLAQSEALKNIMNPNTTALQYAVSIRAGKPVFIEPLLNRKEIVIQTSSDIRVGWGETVTSEGFYVAANGAMGCAIGSRVAMYIQSLSGDAAVTILQLGA